MFVASYLSCAFGVLLDCLQASYALIDVCQMFRLAPFLIVIHVYGLCAIRYVCIVFILVLCVLPVYLVCLVFLHFMLCISCISCFLACLALHFLMFGLHVLYSMYCLCCLCFVAVARKHGPMRAG